MRFRSFLMSLSEYSGKINRKTLGLAVLGVLFAALFLLSVVPGDRKEAEEEVSAEMQGGAYSDPEVLFGTPPGSEPILQQDGEGEGYYRREPGEKVVIDFGSGRMDMTDAVGGWSFGSPLVSLEAFAKAAGFTVEKTAPRDFPAVTYAEILDGNDEPDLEGYTVRYLVTGDGRAFRYASGSKVAAAKDGTLASAVSEVKRGTDGDLLVPAELLPAFEEDGSVRHTTEYRYTEDGLEIVFGEEVAGDD